MGAANVLEGGQSSPRLHAAAIEAMAAADPSEMTGPELVKAYEAVRRTPCPRRERLRRELERRASLAGSVDDPGSGTGYRWDDESESVVRYALDRAVSAEKVKAMGGQPGRPSAARHITLGRLALDESHPGRRVRVDKGHRAG